jgi:hypothetical protein
MFDKIKNFFKKEDIAPEVKRTRKTKTKTAHTDEKLTEKERATAAGEPYIAITRVDVDPKNINSGSFELDWNPKFAANLARAGYQAKPGESEDTIVDRWFQTVCRNIALEVYEQNAADPDFREADALREELRHIRSRDLGNGRSEVS